MGSRLLSVQGLRAVAVLLVVWVHSIDAAEHFAIPRQSQFFHWENFGACGLDIFFVLSGFIVSQVAARSASPGRAGSARRFLARRITRIYPLYWILTLIIILERQLGRYKVPWHAVNWLPTLLLLPSIPSPHDPANVPLLRLGWSLMFEMYFYLVLAAFLAWRPRLVVRGTAIFLCVMVAVGALIGIRRPLIVLWMNPMVLEFVFGCAIGMMFAREDDTAKGRMGAWVGLLGAGLLMATIFTGYGQASNQDWITTGYFCWLRVGVWGVPAALLIAGVVFWNPAMRSGPARMLVFLGDTSYSIYLCTIPARSVAEHFWRMFGHFGADVGVFLCALFCTAVGIVCYLLVERPLMRVFHNWYKPLPFHSAS